MRATKALAVMLTALALAAPASALLPDLGPSPVADPVADSSEPGEVADQAPSEEDIDDVQDRLTNDDPGPPAVAIAEVSLLDADGDEEHPYLCPAAKKGPGEAHACPADRVRDVDVRSDEFTIRTTLINPAEHPTPRTVRVLLFEDDRQVAQTAAVMDVETDSRVLHTYEAACDCYRPSSADVEVRQGWIVDLEIGSGVVGHDYRVVAVSGVNADNVDDPASTDATGTFTAHPADASTAGQAASGSAGSASASWLAIAAASAVAIGAGAWVVKRRI